MSKPKSSIDGFIPRRAGSSSRERIISSGTNTLGDSRTPAPTRAAAAGLSRSEIDATLNGLGDDETLESPKSRKRPVNITKKKKHPVRRVILILVALLLLVGGFVAYRAIIAGNNIFKGNLLGLIQSRPLKEDENGNSNILLLGTSEDDPGHGGAYLTDSMMVVSLNQKQKTAAMFSIPRDLYVSYGMACNSGYEGKINEYFNCVNDDWKSDSAEQERLTKTKAFVGDIFGLDIQYGVHINNTVLKQSVDAVGGIDVDIQGSNGAPGILDRNFDWRCNYECYYVKYDNGVHHLDGEHALYLAMARGDVPPTYGLGNSNFDREKNQQKIIMALQRKAVSTGTLTDFTKVTKLIDALGENLRSNFDMSEVRTLAKLGQEIKPESIRTLTLYSEDYPLVKSGNYKGASVVMPTAGIFDYSEIRQYLKKELTQDKAAREQARIDVMNGSGVAGVAAEEADKLKEAGLTVGEVGNAPEGGDYGRIKIYQVADGYTATKAKLEKLYGTQVTQAPPPVTVTGATKFVIIVGEAVSQN